MDKLTENNKLQLRYGPIACFILVIIYFTEIRPYQEREQRKTDMKYKISQATYAELGDILMGIDFKDQYAIDEIKKRNDHKELLSESIQFSCSTTDRYSNICRNQEMLNRTVSTFHIDLPKNDKLLAKFFKNTDKESLSLSKIFEYEGIVYQYRKLFKNNFEYSSKAEGVELLSNLKLELKKSGISKSEFKELKDKLEKTCSNPPGNYLLKPFCEELSITWEDAVITRFKNDIYHSAKDEGASEKANTLRKLYEEIDEFKNSNYGKNFKAKLTDIQTLAENEMPSVGEMQVANYIQAHKIQEMIQQQKLQEQQQQQQQQQNQKN